MENLGTPIPRAPRQDLLINAEGHSLASAGCMGRAHTAGCSYKNSSQTKLNESFTVDYSYERSKLTISILTYLLV